MINIHDCSLCEHKMVCGRKPDFLEFVKTVRSVNKDANNMLDGDLKCAYYLNETVNIKGVKNNQNGI